MDGAAIRRLRRRVGLTQRDLAERLNVDQGTVSRWERDVDTPRPRREADIRGLLLKAEENRLLTRNLSIVRLNLMPSTLLDRRLRLIEASESALEHYRRRGIDPAALFGKTFDSYAHRVGFPELLKHLQTAGLMSGHALMFRFTMNFQGAGHTTTWEPLIEDGNVVGVLNYASSYFDFPANAERSLERVDFVPTDGQELITLHHGPRAELIP